MPTAAARREWAAASLLLVLALVAAGAAQAQAPTSEDRRARKQSSYVSTTGELVDETKLTERAIPHSQLFFFQVCRRELTSLHQKTHPRPRFKQHHQART
jgi:hypothetical protein